MKLPIIIIIIIFIRTQSTQNEQIIQKIDGTVQQRLKIKGEWTINSFKVATQLLTHYDKVSHRIAFFRFSLVKDIFENGGSLIYCPM